MDDIEELELIISKAIYTFEKVKLETNNGVYSLMIGAFTSMIEHSKSFSILYNSNYFSSTQPIARVIAELYVDIKNIDEDLNYVNYLMYEYYDRQKERAKPQSRKKEMKIRRTKFKTEYEKLSKENSLEKPISIATKFQNVGLSQDYRTFYSTLCGNTHSGVLMFMNRVDDGSAIKFHNQELFKGQASELEKTTVPIISYYLIDACKIIASGFCDELHKEIEAFHSSMLDNQ
jgi:hypothetical protein